MAHDQRTDLYTALGRSGRAVLADERGSIAIEYSLIAGLLSISIVVTCTAIGRTLSDDWYGAISSALRSVFG